MPNSTDNSTDNAMYCQYFDEDGNGPVALEVTIDDFKGLPTPIFGLGFKLAAGELNVNDAPIGGGITFYRDCAERLHTALAAWLNANPARPYPEAAAPAPPAPGAKLACCDRDTNGDGNCPAHEAPGVPRRRPELNAWAGPRDPSAAYRSRRKGRIRR